MRYYVIINGVSSETIQGLAIESLPAISKPLQRSKQETIDGRDGDIITKLGYSAYDKTLKIGLWGNYDINEVIKYFDTEGTITFSNEPDMYYNFNILNRIDFINQLEAFRKATITIHCQPFKYKEEETETLEIITKEVSGTDISVNDAVDGIMDITLKGNTYQKTLSGKNLAQRVDGLWFNGNNNQYYSQEQGYGFKAQIKPNTTYTISKKNASNRFAVCAGSDSVETGNTFRTIVIQESNSSRTTYTFTSGESDTYMWFGVYRGTTQSEIDSACEEVQIEEGSTPTSYEQYCGGTPSPNPSYPQDIHNVSGNNTISVVGKNLYDKDNANVINGYIQGSTGKINGNSSDKSIYIPCLPNTTYTIQREKLNTGNRLRIGSSSVLPEVDVVLDDYVYSTAIDGYENYTYTTTNNAKYLVVYFYTNTSPYTFSELSGTLQIEYGSTSTTYEAYQSQTYPINLGSIELCKIGDYQDSFVYENDKWYKRANVGKIVLDENSNWSSQTGYYQCTTNLGGVGGIGICNYYSYGGTSTPNTFWTTANAFRTNDSTDTLANYKNWLSTHNLILYQPLATPTNTEITDTTLIEQLNAIIEAQTYTGTTNILQTNNDLPFILDIDYFTGTNEITITNNGNTYSKPVLTLVGSGVIGIYLNDSQIFQVSLGTDETIIIDINNMEAYYDATLKNRQVIGDYNNFRLIAGENKIKLTGNWDKLSVDNYSRWI